MKRLIFFTILSAIFVAFIVWKSTSFENTNDVIKIMSDLKEEKCGDADPRDLVFLESKLENIRKLADLEAKCLSRLTDYVTQSVILPNSPETAKSQGQSLADSMQEYKKYGIKPLIFLEISPSWTVYDFSNLSLGYYDKHIKDLFDTLANNGITQDDFYGFIIIPRPNLPNWSKAYITPENYNSYYTVLAKLIVSYYPDVKKGVLFSSSTYEEQPINWKDRDYRSLTNYVNKVEKGLIQIVGIEGYPWISPLDGDGSSIFDPNEYLPKVQIDELVHVTDAKEIIISTNTFSAVYYGDLTKKVVIPADIRNEILEKVLENIKRYNTNRQAVMVLLDQPGSILYSQTDWSYYGTDFTENSLHQEVLLNFLRKLHTSNIEPIVDL